MSELLDRMARAISVHALRLCGWSGEAARLAIEQSESLSPVALAEARVALEALRESTVMMMVACADVPWSQQDVWKRSIEAELREAGPMPTYPETQPQ